MTGVWAGMEKKMATHSSILVWTIPWTEEPGKPQSMGLQRVRHNWATNTSWAGMAGSGWMAGHLSLHEASVCLLAAWESWSSQTFYIFPRAGISRDLNRSCNTYYDLVLEVLECHFCGTFLFYICFLKLLILYWGIANSQCCKISSE